jgi:hypothetical protein
MGDITRASAPAVEDGNGECNLAGGFMPIPMNESRQMEVISKKEVAGVRLFDIQVSEDELAVYVGSLDFVLKHCDDDALTRFCGAYRDEVEGMRDDVVHALSRRRSEAGRQTKAGIQPPPVHSSQPMVDVAAVREMTTDYQLDEEQVQLD